MDAILRPTGELKIDVKDNTKKARIAMQHYRWEYRADERYNTSCFNISYPYI